MKNYNNLALWIMVLLFILPFTAQAQLLERALKDAVRKVEDKVADVIIEKGTDLIAREFGKKLDKWADKQMREAYEKDSTYASKGQFDSMTYASARSYNDFLGALNASVDIPAQYDFDRSLIIETKDSKEKITKSRMYFSSKTSVFGMRMEDQDDAFNLFVYDITNDISVIYGEDDAGNKTVMAIPNIMKVGMSMMSASDKEALAEAYNYKKTGKSEVIAGYNCDEYLGEDDDHTYQVFITDELDINWSDDYIEILKDIMPDIDQTEMPYQNTFSMRSIGTKKKNGKMDHTWEVISVSKETYSINNADYKKLNLGE